MGDFGRLLTAAHDTTDADLCWHVGLHAERIFDDAARAMELEAFQETPTKRNFSGRGFSDSELAEATDVKSQKALADEILKSVKVRFDGNDAIITPIARVLKRWLRQSVSKSVARDASERIDDGEEPLEPEGYDAAVEASAGMRLRVFPRAPLMRGVASSGWLTNNAIALCIASVG